jgi:hypothetical protein
VIFASWLKDTEYHSSRRSPQTNGPLFTETRLRVFRSLVIRALMVTAPASTSAPVKNLGENRRSIARIGLPSVPLACSTNSAMKRWRFGLENDVLRRFSVEVAWSEFLKVFKPSVIRGTVQDVGQEFGVQEIEACINELDDMAEHLEERRRSRKPCHYPPENRPQD